MNLPWKPLLITLIIGWFLGMTTGVLTPHWMPPSMMHRMHRAGREKLFHDLNFSADQRTQAEGIINRSHTELDQIFDDTNPRIEKVRMELHDQLRAILTPEQQEKFDRRDVAFAEHFKKRYEMHRDTPHP